MKNSLRCPSCNSGLNETTNCYRVSYWSNGRERHKLRRRRVCHHCSRVFYTVEDLDPDSETGQAPSPQRAPATTPLGPGRSIPLRSLPPSLQSVAGRGVADTGQGEQPGGRIINPFV